MHVIANRTFSSVIERGEAGVLEDLVIDRCEFEFCAISETTSVYSRTRVRNVTLRNCLARNHTGVGPAILELSLLQNSRHTPWNHAPKVRGPLHVA